ncbi:MAG: hypothetical protein DBX53_05780 [Clostridiales bacterium]|nr:MAG: hypothetical protein DBX53_05780 [Clostridiales bacterium]
MRRRIVGLFVLLLFISSIGSTAVLAAPTKPDIQVGTSVLSIDEAALNAAGYKFVDDTDPDILYGWPYNLYTRAASESAYGGNVIFSMGQVSATITYAFSGTYLAVVFAETYWAAEVVVTIDDTEYGSFTPHNASVEKETPGDSKVIFVKDDLAEGDHVVTITHKTAYTSGEDNVKADGTAYYDNDAFFDCFIVKGTQAEEQPIDKVTEGSRMSDYTEDILNNLNLTVIDDTNEEIQYQWPYDMGSRITCPSAYGGSVISNVGQVSASFSYDFEGTYLAAAFGEVYYACTIIITIDGEKVGEITPHTAVKTADGSVPSQSKVVFVKDDLAEGKHTVTITHEVAYTSGEDNIREDGNAYYDNYALFDCFIVEADSNQTEPEITPAPGSTPDSGDNIPVTGDKTSFAAAFCIIAAAAAAIFVVIKRKSEA